MKTMAAVVALGLLGGSQISVGLWLNFDPTQNNTLELHYPDALGGGVRSTRLVGGAHTIVTFDLFKLISLQGLNVDVTIDEIRIAGESFEILFAYTSTTGCTL